MNIQWMFSIVKSIFAFLVFSLWASAANATPVSVSFTSSAGSIAGGDIFSLTVSLNESVSFTNLDALLLWDSTYLVPIDQVSSSHFLTLGSVFAGTDLEPATYDTMIGNSSITISLFSLIDPAHRANGPGELFTMTFKALTGVVFPTTTIIKFDALTAPSSANGAGLALSQIFDLDGNLIDPELEPWTATPGPLVIALSNPTQPVPEPEIIQLLVLGGLLMRRFASSERSIQKQI